MAGEEKKRKADQLANMFPSGTPASKQRTLPFKMLTKEEAELKQHLEIAEHKYSKSIANSAELKEKDAKCKLAHEWGLSLPRPPPRTSRGGPKPRSERWMQGLYDYLDDIIAGKRPAPKSLPPLDPPRDWNHKATDVATYCSGSMAVASAQVWRRVFAHMLALTTVRARVC